MSRKEKWNHTLLDKSILCCVSLLARVLEPEAPISARADISHVCLRCDSFLCTVLFKFKN